MAAIVAAEPEGKVWAMAFLPIALICLPFDAIADTICLPYDVFQIGKSNPPTTSDVARQFLSQQPFAQLYSHYPYTSYPQEDGTSDVYFWLNENTTTSGVVRVNRNTGECKWIGNKKP